MFPPTHTKFQMGQSVHKTKGSQWHGHIVGWYSSSLTPEGYAVESETERGSVQIYPAAALEASPPVRLCCGQRHAGAQCPDGLVMCGICFDRFPVEKLNVVDGKPEDICQDCASRENHK